MTDLKSKTVEELLSVLDAWRVPYNVVQEIARRLEEAGKKGVTVGEPGSTQLLGSGGNGFTRFVAPGAGGGNLPDKSILDVSLENARIAFGRF